MNTRQSIQFPLSESLTLLHISLFQLAKARSTRHTKNTNSLFVLIRVFVDCLTVNILVEQGQNCGLRLRHQHL
jgi:hypothetical protein